MALEEVKSDSPIDTQPAIPARIPMGTILGEMAAAMDDTKKSIDRYKKVTVLQPLRDLKENISQLTEEELAALQEVADAKENHNRWSYNDFLSSAGYGALSICFGVCLLAGKESRGWHFIYGGTALLANTYIDYKGRWNKLSQLVSFGHETSEQILTAVLPVASVLITMIYSSYHLSQLPEPMKKIAEWINVAMACVNVIILIGNKYTSWIKGQAEQQLMIIQGKISTTTMKIEPLNILNENLTNLAKQVNDAFKGGIKKIMKGTSAIPMGAV